MSASKKQNGLNQLAAYGLNYSMFSERSVIALCLGGRVFESSPYMWNSHKAGGGLKELMTDVFGRFVAYSNDLVMIVLNVLNVAKPAAGWRFGRVAPAVMRLDFGSGSDSC